MLLLKAVRNARFARIVFASSIAFVVFVLYFFASKLSLTLYFTQ